MIIKVHQYGQTDPSYLSLITNFTISKLGPSGTNGQTTITAADEVWIVQESPEEVARLARPDLTDENNDLQRIILAFKASDAHVREVCAKAGFETHHKGGVLPRDLASVVEDIVAERDYWRTIVERCPNCKGAGLVTVERHEGAFETFKCGPCQGSGRIPHTDGPK